MKFTVGKRSSEPLSELDYSEAGTCEDADCGQADTYKAARCQLLAKPSLRAGTTHRSEMTETFWCLECGRIFALAFRPTEKPERQSERSRS